LDMSQRVAEQCRKAILDSRVLLSKQVKDEVKTALQSPHA